MSRSMHWYKAYPADFLDATVGWPIELKGAYRLLLDVIYMHDGSVADDSALLSAHLGLSSKRKWTSVRNQLLERGKIEVENGYIKNDRATIETLSRKHRHDKRDDNREIIDPQLNKNNDLKSLDTDTDLDIENNTNSSLSKTAEEREASLDLFWDIYPATDGQSQSMSRPVWFSMSEPDRQACLTYLQGAKPEIKTYPFNFLKGREWENGSVAPPVVVVPPAEDSAERVLFDLLAQTHSPMVWRNMFEGKVRVHDRRVVVADSFDFSRIEQKYAADLERAGFELARAA